MKPPDCEIKSLCDAVPGGKTSVSRKLVHLLPSEPKACSIAQLSGVGPLQKLEALATSFQTSAGLLYVRGEIDLYW